MAKLEKFLLKDIAVSQTGPFGSQLHEKDYVQSGTPIVTVEHLGEIGFYLDNLPMVSDKDKARLSKYILKEGDIVFSRVGSIDRCTYVSKNEDGWLFSGRCLRVRFNEKADPKYVSYYFRQKYFKEMMLHISVGATMPSLNTYLMDNIPLYLPSKDKQQKIAAILSALDAKVSLNQRINMELESMVKTLFNYWFVQFEFPNENGKPYKSAGGKMIWNEKLKRDIPVEWKNGVLSNIGTISGGSTPPREVAEYFDFNGTPWITPRDLSLNTGNKFITKGENGVTKQGIKAANLTIMPKGTILLSSRAPIGYMAIAREEVTTNQGFKSFIPNTGFSIPFIYYTIQNSIPTIINHSSGSTFKEVSASVLKAISICLPPPSITDKFEANVTAIFERQDKLELESQTLRELRDLLIPMLMNGQVSVR